MDAEAKVAIRVVHIEFEHIPHRGVHCLVFESLVPFVVYLERYLPYIVSITTRRFYTRY